MCGIFCAFNYAKQGIKQFDLIQATELAAHRGPDNIGYFDDGECFLGHTRLAIVGIDERGNQPFFFKDLVMVFNGEIFNYIELMEELIILGHEFDSLTDTEVVIKAFYQWGGDCFAKFNGMWSLVIYDREKKNLTVSRDRFGQKPLFVMKRNDAIFFSSEFQQLVEFSDRSINFEIIQKFLKEGGYESDQKTFFKAIEIFPKAHYCEIDIHSCVSHRYWDYWNGNIHNVADDCFKEFSVLLEDAVKIRLQADVPFGILLSGGVDSTLIAAYARKSIGSEFVIPSFTYASGDLSDESQYAESVAEKLNCSVALCFQDEDPRTYINRLRKLVRNMGRGHSSPAIISVDYLYENASSQGIKVILDGQGADELLGGYKNYFVLLISSYLCKLKFKQATYLLIDHIRTGFFDGVISFIRNTLSERTKKIGRYFYGYEKLFANYRPHHSKNYIDSIFDSKKNKNGFNRHLIKQHDEGLENLLYYGDISSMKNSVENRSPFLDHRLIDFVFSRSDKLKVWNGINKYALRTLPMYETFKKELERPKIGFSSDIHEKIKAVMIDDLKTSPILKWPIFSNKLPGFLEGHQCKTLKYERILFRFYQVHLWHEEFHEVA